MSVDKPAQKLNKSEQGKLMESQIEYGWVNDDLSLLDPNIWIADTGATVHSTSSQQLAKTWNKDIKNIDLWWEMEIVNLQQSWKC